MSQFNDQYGSTDVIFQSISLFVEGVQVPFQAISISSSHQNLPSAIIQIPIQVGLMDIVRYYQPKVHVFFTDPISDKDCLLFSGVITSVSYQKSIRGSGSASISFTCEHKYKFLEEITLDFSGYTSDTTTQITAYDGDAPIGKMNMFNSLMSISQAMSGIVGLNKSTEPTEDNILKAVAEPTVLKSDLSEYQHRLLGMPGVMMNYWNQLMMTGYSDSKRYQSLVSLYRPLVEVGLKFFNRLSGHYYIEKRIQDSKVDPCPGTTTTKDSDKKLVAPSMRLFLKSAVQADMAVRLKDYLGQFSGESTSLFGVFRDFVDAIDYDLLFLNSPAEVPLDPTSKDPSGKTYAIDTIIKPQLPFYYSPACNIILPSMYSDLNVNQSESSVPTRVTVVQDLVTGTGKFGQNYRAPASIRETVALGSKDMDQNYDLNASTGPFYGRYGKYEQGRGVKHSRILMPNWLAHYGNSLSTTDESNSPGPEAGSDEEKWLEVLREAWEDRYKTVSDIEDGKQVTDTNSAMNPWSPKDSRINSFQRIMFAAAEYRFTMEVAASKAGSIYGIFNPYIIPGYPMDIVSVSEVEPSFHAMCSSVTHSITSRSISTSIGFVGAVTYTELANYYLQFIHPWLQTALAIVNKEIIKTDKGEEIKFNTSILYNSQAKMIADEFYKSTLGVNARAPEELIDFNTGRLMPLDGKGTSSVKSHKGAELNPNLTASGNLSFAYRPIETRDQVEERYTIKFIDMSPGNYNPSVISYTDEVLTNSELLEPGQSQFLDYREVN